MTDEQELRLRYEELRDFRIAEWEAKLGRPLTKSEKSDMRRGAYHEAGSQFRRERKLEKKLEKSIDDMSDAVIDLASAREMRSVKPSRRSLL